MYAGIVYFAKFVHNTISPLLFLQHRQIYQFKYAIYVPESIQPIYQHVKAYFYYRAICRAVTQYADTQNTTMMILRILQRCSILSISILCDSPVYADTQNTTTLDPR